jgi:integrase
MSTIRFALRIDKCGKQGLSPIDLIYQISGERKYFRLKEKLRAQSWDQVKQAAVFLDRKTARTLLPEIDYDLLPTAADIHDINTELLSLKKEISQIEKRFELNKVYNYDPAMIIEQLQADHGFRKPKNEPAKFLFDFIDKYIDDHRAIREPGSLSVYKALRTNLRDFQHYTKKKVSFAAIDYSFFEEFNNFLVTGAGTTIGKHNELIARQCLNNTTVAKRLSTLKTFLNYARKHDIQISDRHKEFKITRRTLDVIALTGEEFERLYNLDLSSNKPFDQVRDVFCFACVTGLRYSDLKQLRREHIKNGEIRLTIKKTRDLHSIPLSKYSLAILDKYAGSHLPLPVISNQKTNEHLKELCKLAEINEQVERVTYQGAKKISVVHPKHDLITVHVGRKTFVTLSLEKGMNAEEVMALSGHRDYKSFSRYVKITEQRKKLVMGKAWGAITPIISENPLKVVI